LGDAQADRRLELLRRVGAHGSISQAARSAGVSYKAAWQAIHTLTNLAGQPLVESSVGGAGGGGARLTAAGEQLLRAAGQMEAARRTVLAHAGGPAASVIGAPRTSMRNHLRCTVAQLASAGARDPLVRVSLRLDGGQAQLACVITRESAQLLGLVPGLVLLALCKATAVRIAAGASDGGGAVNTLPGRVLRAARGAANDELTLTLAGGQQLVGFAAHPHRLRAGSRACAQVEESAVVLALA